jgi:sugar O-acyltransferase (sialic acid O-acetyltransferase NeuD family)
VDAMKIIIIGGKGTAIDIGEQIVNANEQFNLDVEFLGWAVDDDSLGLEINGYPVICKPRELANKFDYPDVKLIFSLYKIGKMEERVNLLKSYGVEQSRFANFIHPLAYVAKSVTLGIGNVILSHACIFSNIRIGNYNIIYSNSFVGHDSQIGDNNFFATSTIGSKCIVGNGVFIGMNSTINEGLVISDFATVGMESGVLHDVEARRVVLGNPARPLQKS